MARRVLLVLRARQGLLVLPARRALARRGRRVFRVLRELRVPLEPRVSGRQVLLGQRALMALLVLREQRESGSRAPRALRGRLGRTVRPE